jgi:hypothetical protein
VRVGVLSIVLILCIGFFSAQQAHGKEPFNIKGIILGDTLDNLKKVFPEIKIESFENKAHCKDGDVVIENGSSFNAVKNEAGQNYSFELIFIDGVQSVFKAAFSYAATSVSKDLFIRHINDKYDIDVINSENTLTVKNAMHDYNSITHFIVPSGHFFKIVDDDVSRLKYASANYNPAAPAELTHTIIIESQKYASLKKKQEELGAQEKIAKEYECGKKELQALGF